MGRKARWSLIGVVLGTLAATGLAAYHFADRPGKELKYVEQGNASWYGAVFTARKRPAVRNTTRTS